MKYPFIEKHRKQYSVNRLCLMLGIMRSSYYAWKKRKPSQREQNNQALIEHIRRIYKNYRKTYGSPRMYVQLKKEEISCSKKRVARMG
jgi:putative transposase